MFEERMMLKSSAWKPGMSSEIPSRNLTWQALNWFKSSKIGPGPSVVLISSNVLKQAIHKLRRTNNKTKLTKATLRRRGRFSSLPKGALNNIRLYQSKICSKLRRTYWDKAVSNSQSNSWTYALDDQSNCASEAFPMCHLLPFHWKN